MNKDGPGIICLNCGEFTPMADAQVVSIGKMTTMFCRTCSITGRRKPQREVRRWEGDNFIVERYYEDGRHAKNVMTVEADGRIVRIDIHDGRTGEFLMTDPLFMAGGDYRLSEEELALRGKRGPLDPTKGAGRFLSDLNRRDPE